MNTDYIQGRELKISYYFVNFALFNVVSIYVWII